MKNGITIKGVEYKAVSVNAPIGVFENCEKCDIGRICNRKNVQYPCDLFITPHHIVYFKKVVKKKEE